MGPEPVAHSSGRAPSMEQPATERVRRPEATKAMLKKEAGRGPGTRASFAASQPAGSEVAAA